MLLSIFEERMNWCGEVFRQFVEVDVRYWSASGKCKVRMHTQLRDCQTVQLTILGKGTAAANTSSVEERANRCTDRFQKL